MRDILQDVSTPTLISAIEENLFELARAMGRPLIHLSSNRFSIALHRRRTHLNTNSGAELLRTWLKCFSAAKQ